VKRFLDHVQKAGVPDKVTLKYLEKVGFKSKNDRYILGILKFLGFVDSTGVPTKIWRAYRNKESAGATLATAMREAFGDLFRTYPDAHRKDNEALRNYFSAHTNVAESTLGLIVTTFKAIAAIADFESAAPVSAKDVEEVTAAPVGAKAGGRTQRDSLADNLSPARPAININIQLQLPATEDGAIYDKLFAALKKHLFS
jgi:Family of unknown function (DUF5343)